MPKPPKPPRLVTPVRVLAQDRLVVTLLRRIIVGTPPSGFVPDLAVHPMTYPAPTLPAAGGTFVDPVFGSTLIRVTDANNAPTGVTMFSDAQDMQWNVDGTMFLLFINEVGTHLYGFNRSTYALTDHGVLTTCLFDGAQWSWTDPHVLYASDADRKIYKFAGLPGNLSPTSTVHDFTAELPAGGYSSSRIGVSDTDRYFMMTGSSLSDCGLAGNVPCGQDVFDYVVIWDTQTNSVKRSLHIPTHFGVAYPNLLDIVTNGTTTVTSASANFGTDLIGQRFIVGGGTANLNTEGLIVGRPDAHTLTVETALAAGTGASLRIGYYLHSSDLIPGDTWMRLGGIYNAFGQVFWNWQTDEFSSFVTADADNFAAHKTFGPIAVYNSAVGGGGPGGDRWLTRGYATPHTYSTLLDYPLLQNTHTYLWDSHGSRQLLNGAFCDDPQYPSGPSGGWTLHSGAVYKKTGYPSVLKSDTGWWNTSILTAVEQVPTAPGQFYHDQVAQTLYVRLPDDSAPAAAALLTFSPWVPCQGEIVMNVPLGGGTWVTRRYCHHRSMYNGGGFAFPTYPLAHPDPWGRFVLFQSNWGVYNGRVDAFIVDGDTSQS